MAGSPTGWARGCVSPEKLKRDAAEIRAMRRAQIATRRARIAALSNRDIQVMMAETIIESITKRGRATDSDFDNAGLPLHRLEQNKDAAMRLARRMCPTLDAILAAQVAA